MGGEQCFFMSLGLGVVCKGYELLCESLVDEANAISSALGLDETLGAAKIEFLCEDILSADFGKAGLLYLNDYAWPPSSRTAVVDAALAGMPQGAPIVSYHPFPTDLLQTRSASLVATLHADVSWKQQHEFHIFTPASKDEL